MLWLPEILFGVRLFLGPFGPTAAALILTLVREGRAGVAALLKRGCQGFPVVWLIPVLLLMPTVTGAALAIVSGLTGVAPRLPAFEAPWLIPVAFIYILVLGGPLGEEFGWRGYALPRLQARHSALVSSLILGAVWALWHVPLFFMPSQQAVYGNIPFWGFAAGAMMLSVLFTWVYNNTGGSVLAAILFHTTGNLAQFLFPALESPLAGLASLLLNLLVVFGVVLVFGPAHLARGRSRVGFPGVSG